MGCLDFGQLRKHLRRLWKKGLFLEAGLLLKAATAGLWTGARAKESAYNCSGLCPLCGEEEDTEEHRIWNCRIVNESDDKDISDSNGLRRLALPKLGEEACFWLRGLLLVDWLPTPDFPLPSDCPVFVLGGIDEVDGIYDVSGLSIYLDESGGECSSTPCSRRCGWGWAILGGKSPNQGGHGDGFFLRAGWFAALDGQQQTQIVAAMAALLYVLQNTSGEVTVLLDCQYLIDGWQDIDSRRSGHSRHAGFWFAIREARMRRVGSVTLVKVDAHTDVDEYAMGEGELEHWVGNHFSDRLAARAAAENAVPSVGCINYEILQGRAFKVQKRIIAAHRLALDKLGPDRRFQPLVDKPSTLEKLVADSDHALTWRSGMTSVSCVRCGQSVSRSRMKQWLLGGPCSPTVRDHNPEIRHAAGTIAVGRSSLHASHNLKQTQGVGFCAFCGFYASVDRGQKSSAKRLVLPCAGAPTKASAGYLRRLAVGKPPRADMETIQLQPIAPRVQVFGRKLA